jgi:foldase protein PrsA
MRPLTLIGALLALGAGTAMLSGCARQDHRADVVAIVGQKTITRGELQDELCRRYGPLELRSLVDRTIVKQLAEKRGIKLDPARVDAKLEQQIAQAGGSERFEQKLAREYQTREMLRATLADDALAEQVMAAQVAPTDQEMTGYYRSHQGEFRHGEMVKGRLILLESRANAQAIHGILNEPGADFAGLAKELSIDPNTRDKSGDMGWIERGDYNSKITDAAFKLKPGQCSGIIEYPDGFAIVRAEGRKPAGTRPYDEVQDTIRAILTREKEEAARPQWAAEQRKQADIRVRDRSLARAFELIRDK